MATRHDSSAERKRKARAKLGSLTSKTEWACWMQGAEPEWMHTDEARRYARAFTRGMPMWLVQSQPWRPATGARFKTIRTDALNLTVAECAAYLGVSQAELKRWEAGESPVPVAAFEALRQQSEAFYSKLSQRMWDGWFINRKTGELVSPDVGNLAVKPAELNTLPALYGELSRLRLDTERQARRIDELEAENAALRSGAKVKDVSRELEDMHARIGDLLAAMQTADVLPFPVAREVINQPATRKATS